MKYRNITVCIKDKTPREILPVLSLYLFSYWLTFDVFSNTNLMMIDCFYCETGKKNKSSKCVSRCELGSCRQFCPKINSCLVTWKEAFQRMENLVLRMEGFIALPPKTLTPVLFHFYLYFRETSAIWPVSRGRALIRIRHAAPRRCASPSGIPPPPSPPLPTQVSYLRPEGPLLHSDIILPIYFLVCVRSAVLEL